MYKAYFRINDVFDKNDKYDLFILKLSMAASDLVTVFQLFKYQINNMEILNRFFFFKLCLGFTREAFELLKNNHEKFKAKCFDRILGVEEEYQKLYEIIYKGAEFEIFKECAFNKERHNIFHYPDENDDELIKNVFDALVKENLSYVIDKDNHNHKTNYNYAETFQFNMLFNFYKIDDNKEAVLEAIKPLLTVNTMIYGLIDKIIVDFFDSKKVPFENIDMQN